jgi:transposase
VARCLEELGHEVIVADPNFAPMYAARSRKIKTDRRDARALAGACRRGADRPAHRLSDAQQQVRGGLAVRDALVRTRTGSIAVIRALLRQHGWQVPTGSAASQPRMTAHGAAGTTTRSSGWPGLPMTPRSRRRSGSSP